MSHADFWMKRIPDQNITNAKSRKRGACLVVADVGLGVARNRHHIPGSCNFGFCSEMGRHWRFEQRSIYELTYILRSLWLLCWNRLGKLSVGGGETSAEAGRPLNSFALFHLLSLERQRVLFKDKEERWRVWFWTCSFEVFVTQVKILSRPLDMYVLIDFP